MEESTFVAFCDATNKGKKSATDKTIKKICTDCKLYSKSFTANDVDIDLRKFLGNTKKDMTYKEFLTFLDKHFIPSYAQRNNIKDAEKAKEEVNTKLKTTAPKAHGATKSSGDDATKRLTDVKGYTGAHKERFDQDTGKGKGIEGREYVADDKASEGYVGGYKGKDTYDKKH